MASESRYHIATVRKRRIIDNKGLERRDRIQQQSGKVRDRLYEGHEEAQTRIDQIRTGKKRYKLEKRERLISGDKQKGPKAAHSARMQEVETLFDLQSKQLLELASCKNGCLEFVHADERKALEYRWGEIIKPTEDIVATICRQLG